MSEAFSIDKCKAWLTREVVSGKSTLQAFQNRLIDWHIKQYAEANNPPALPWADESLKNMQAAIKELKLEEPRKSLFAQFKEDK